MKRIIYTGLTLVWMCIIFWFSAAPAKESSEMSMSAGTLILQKLVPGYEEWEEGRQQEAAEKIEYPIRKCAHASEYAVLGLLLMLAWNSYLPDAKRGRLLMFAVGTLYAASDEIHQLFVPGRSGRLTDVLIDSAGLLAGIFLIYMLLKCRDSRKSRKTS